MRPSVKTCAFALFSLLCTNIQFCKAQWWWGNPTSLTRSISTTMTPNDLRHINLSTPEECARQCRDRERPKNCYYRFVIEYYTTNGQACDFCQPPVNDSRINLKCQCIISDGFEKTVFSINRMIPGPSIQVCQNDFVIVDVVNEAEGLEVVIHWHGIFQNGYQYYDGVPHVTQCPIHSADTFRYAFRVQNSGTHFYHSHMMTQLLDGQYGSLIVRDSPTNNPHNDLYDYDDHICVISDLFHELSFERYPGRYRSNVGQIAQNILINGRGNWTDPVTGVSNNIPLSRFIVRLGQRYRFRVINACGTVCPIMLSIQNHEMLIIAVDGEYVKPIPVNAINMASGERVDFVLSTNQQTGNYWVMVTGLDECENSMVYQLAILSYEGSSEASLSPKPRYSDIPQNVNRTFNPLNSTDCNNNTCVHDICKIKDIMEDEIPLNREADILLKLPFGFFNYTSSPEMLQSLFNTDSPDYKKFFVAIDRSHIISRVNNYTYRDMPQSLLSEDSRYELMCSKSTTPATCTEPCSCTNVYHIPLHAVVDVMIYDQTPVGELNHPFHLHGYYFCVMELGQFDNAANKDYITEEEAKNKFKVYNRRFQNDGYYNCCAPKDTVMVPVAGYAILRFKANNPGWWFFHCHFNWHTSSGMNIIFHVGKPSDLPPVPPYFPKCYNWQPSVNAN